MDRFNFEEDDPSHSDDGRYVLYEDVKKLEADKQALEDKLLNAFQLVKNGKSYPHIKYDEFEKLLERDIDHNGVIKPQTD